MALPLSKILQKQAIELDKLIEETARILMVDIPSSRDLVYSQICTHEKPTYNLSKAKHVCDKCGKEVEVKRDYSRFE